MNLVPLGDKVIIKPQEAKSVTAGGIVLPDSAKETPAQGKVLAVGDGRMLENGTRCAMQVQEGDRVLYERYFGCKVTIENVDYLILSESEILAIL